MYTCLCRQMFAVLLGTPMSGTAGSCGNSVLSFRVTARLCFKVSTPFLSSDLKSDGNMIVTSGNSGSRVMPHGSVGLPVVSRHPCGLSPGPSPLPRQARLSCSALTEEHLQLSHTLPEPPALRLTGQQTNTPLLFVGAQSPDGGHRDTCFSPICRAGHQLLPASQGCITAHPGTGSRLGPGHLARLPSERLPSATTGS